MTEHSRSSEQQPPPKTKTELVHELVRALNKLLRQKEVAWVRALNDLAMVKTSRNCYPDEADRIDEEYYQYAYYPELHKEFLEEHKKLYKKAFAEKGFVQSRAVMLGYMTNAICMLRLGTAGYEEAGRHLEAIYDLARSCGFSDEQYFAIQMSALKPVNGVDLRWVEALDAGPNGHWTKDDEEDND